MSRDLEDFAMIAGLVVVGYMAYETFFPKKTLEEVIAELDTHLKGFIDTIKLPELPALPTFQPPLQQAAAAAPPQQPAAPPQTPTSPPAADNSSSQPEITPDKPSSNTIPEPEDDAPKVNETPDEQKPADSGQLKKNPVIPPPPPNSGGALIAFAGDWDSNNKSQATSQQITKQGCQTIIGVGDYSYSGEKAAAWFDKIVGQQWRGKFKGCIGNHDTHDKGGFLQIFGQTGWNVGAKVAPNLSVIFIDTESGIAAPLLDSLTTAAKSQSKFVAYVFHKPYITSDNGHHTPGENKWSSIIEAAVKKHGIQLVIAGHNHLYEHFKCGVTHYVTSGAAGRKFYGGNCQNKCGPVKCVESTNGFLKVAVGNSLMCQFISNSGEMLDSFQIT